MMRKVSAWEIATGVMLVAIGWSVVDRGKMHWWGVSIMYPRQFGWALIVLGVGIPLWLYCMRSRQNKDK